MSVLRAKFSSFAGDFDMKKSAAEIHRMLSNTYGETAISKRTCRKWFQCFRNCDFDIEARHGER